MKNKLFKVIASLGMVWLPMASMAGGTKGGGNSIESQFELARAYAVKALTGYNPQLAVKLPEQNRKLLDIYASMILADISSVQFQFDHVTAEPFNQSNGSDSGIQTQIGSPLSPIEIRTKVLVPKGEITIAAALSWIGHEVGHHIPEVQGFSEEQKAWAVSAALVQLFNSQVKFPELLNIGGEYVAVGPPRCRDIAHIEADPFTGRVSIATSTTTSSHCYDRTPDYKELYFGTSGAFLVQLTPKGSKNISSGPRESIKFYPLPDGGAQVQLNLEAEYPNGAWYYRYDLKFIKK